MKETQSVHIDFDQILETLRKGARRADVFMGIGLNAAEHTPPLSHILAADNIMQIHLVKMELTDKEKTHVAQEFGKWIRANGLRELLETFSIFMNELYTAAFLIRLHQRQLDRRFNKCHPAKFERYGIWDQVKRMSEVVPVADNDIKIMSSLNRVRNCYAHRRGVVNASDLDDGTEIMLVQWSAVEIEIHEPDGNVVQMNDLPGRLIKNGGNIALSVKSRSKEFKRGSELVLNKHELKEICLCVLRVGESLFREMVSLAKGAGVLKDEIGANLNDPQAV